MATSHQWLFQISMKLPSAKIESGPIYDRLVHKFSFSGLKMRLAHQWLFQISMKLPSTKIEFGSIYDRLVHKFSLSGLKMRLAGF